MRCTYTYAPTYMDTNVRPHVYVHTHMHTQSRACFRPVNLVKIGFVTLDRKALYPHINAVSESIVSTYFVICYSQP